jgi:hypothetical protein
MEKLLFKSTFLFIILFSISFSLNAQTEKGHKNFIRLGYQASQLTDSGTNYYDNISNGFFVAFMRQRPFAAILTTQIGLQYHQGGSKQDDNNSVKLGYLAVPANIGIHLGPVKAYGGALAAVKIHSEGKVLGVTGIPESSEFNSFDATAFLGISVKILFLGVDVQYHWGLVNVIENYKNNFLQIGANLYF